uniref:KIAA0232 n=1 Tax=Knipowitschia caucasica TaxID=637954 RepID=A0AAV2KLJ5_KNICA
MRPMSTVSDGPAPPEHTTSPFPLVGPLSASEMSLLQSLGPVQSWLGQELEKCGIDAMIYTRYVLSLLLHDSYDYDLQDQENDIFLGWEKSAGKKWGKSKKKGVSDLSLEEMKKQAAVQCLRSASDENSGIENLVEELCCKLKDIQNKQKEAKQIQKKSDGAPIPEPSDSPTSKDQVEMYYEAFPPLSEKPVCLQEIMTVWNKTKACAYSSSSSAAPQTSTDTSSPKDCNSDGEAGKEQHLEACGSMNIIPTLKSQHRRSKKEKENRYHSGAAAEERPSKKQIRHRSEGKYRPRSWSSGSSEAGSSSSGNQGEVKTSRSKAVRVRHKSREAIRNRRSRNSAQTKTQVKFSDDRRNLGSSSSANGGAVKPPQLYKRGKRQLKESRKHPGWGEAKECALESRKEYMEEPLCCLEVQAKEAPLQGPQKKAVQRSEYHLWEGNKDEQDLAKNKLSKVNNSGDYMTPSKPWGVQTDRENSSFILGGVYGELKSVSSDKSWAVVPPTPGQPSLLKCAAATSGSDMLTITGTDVFMNTSSCFAPGHRPLWRPLVSFGHRDQAIRGGGDAINKGFSFIFHEDLLGTCGGLYAEDQSLGYPFAPFNLNNPFSKVLHVECSFEPEEMASFSPGFKPKSILCSDSENEAFHSRIYGINQTQYRAIRISPRTHFRPISASELSPGEVSDSEAEMDKEETSLPAVAPVDVFDDPQADLKPLEDDAECEGPYYGKSELESGKFLPRLKKSGMEKSAQTSLDSQEGSNSLLPIAEQEICPDITTSAATGDGEAYTPVLKMNKGESSGEKQSSLCASTSHIPKYGIAYDFVGDLPEFPVLNIGAQGGTGNHQEERWWQNTLCSPIFPGSQCSGSSNI